MLGSWIERSDSVRDSFRALFNEDKSILIIYWSWTQVVKGVLTRGQLHYIASFLHYLDGVPVGYITSTTFMPNRLAKGAV